MVCDSLEVETRRLIAPYQSDEPLEISIDGYDSLFVIKQGNRRMPGTKTILKLRETHPWQKMKKDDFFNCVKNILPLPPFKIDIETDDNTYISSPNMFEELDLELEKDYSWRFEKNIEIVEIDLNDVRKGFRGKAEIAFIVNSKGEVINSLNIYEREVVIDNNSYSFSSSISYGTNCIIKNSTSINVDGENGDIYVDDNIMEILYSSDAALSVHGIDVPAKLFNNYRGKAVLNLPFPIRFRLDIGLSHDLNLNSSRTQVIYDEIWLAFKKSFYETVCEKVKDKLKEKWIYFKEIFGTSSLNEFNEIIKSI